MDTLHSQKLHIPNLWPAFEGWERGVNPCYYSSTGGEEEEEKGYGEGRKGVQGGGRLRRAIDGRLEGLIADEKRLMKAKAVDIGLFACWYVLFLFVGYRWCGFVLPSYAHWQKAKKWRPRSCTAILAPTEGKREMELPHLFRVCRVYH